MKTVVHPDRVESFADIANLHPLLIRHMRDILCLDRHQHDALVQDHEVFESV